MDWFRLSESLTTHLADRTAAQTLRRLRLIDRNGGLESEQAFLDFFLAQKNRGLSQASLNKYIQSVTHFCRFAGSSWHLPKVKKEYARRRATYSDEEINRILSLSPLRHERTHTHIVLELLAYTGARPSEIANLRQLQVDYQNCGLNIAGTKTGKDRFVPIPETVLNKLSRLPDPLFSTNDGTIRESLKRRCKLLNIQYRPPYALRHSRISAWVTSGIDLPTVSDLAGNSAQVIMSNYWHTSVAHLQNAIKRDTLRRSQLMPDQKVREIAKLLEEIKNSFKLDEDEDLDVHLEQKTDQVIFKVSTKKTESDQSGTSK